MAAKESGDRTATYEGEPRSGASARWVRLSFVYPPDAICAEMLGDGANVIGREPPGLAIPQPTLSRRHFEIRIDGAAISGTDLGSRNGSWVNGDAQGTVPRALADGDVLRFGEVIAVLEVGQGDAGRVVDEPTLAVPGRSAAAAVVREQVRVAAADPSPALILGETGTGKEWVARELHERSGRPGAFVAANCAALTPSLVESQLFGHERGAFTGAVTAQPGLFRAAHQGTLFLDEIGELPLELQAKLLRAVELGAIHPVGAARAAQVDVRVVAATNRDLRGEVEAGRFRRDLLARLSLCSVGLPPLRDRRSDIVTWIELLHEQWRAERGATVPPPHFTAEATEAILLHGWEENLRGLNQLVHALGSRPHDGPTPRARLPRWLQPEHDSASPEPSMAATPVLAPRARPEHEDLLAILREKQWNIAAVAAHYGRARRQIYRWIEHYGIERNS